MKLTLVKLLLPLSGLPAALTGPLFNGKGAVFEDALRQLCCAKPVCAPESCRLLQNCPISGLVARGVSPDPELLRRHQKPGLPYVFQIRYGRDEFDLVILGSAIAELALFLDVLFPQFSGNKTFAVTAFDNQNSPVAISFDSDGSAVNLPLLETSELLECSTPRFYTCRQIRIDLVTPLRMVRGGRELNRFDPVFFIRSLLRRLSSLAAYYGEEVDSDHFRYLAGLAGEVRLLRQAVVRDTVAHGRGISGSYELQGPFAELGPLLCLGALVHLGKGASYGQGAFDVTPIP